MPSLMVQGVSSHAGKSLVVTALCRWLARQGVSVAPFKAQNMSNNARVVDGGEIGTAQYLQALAAGIRPDTRINPILLKPESDTASQVIVDGVYDRGLSRSPWRGRSKQLWPHVVDAFVSLQKEFDVVVIEGAGSPAETNLWDDDIVNMRVADLAASPVVLVADIDRGGAFAHLYGTWSLLPPRWRSHIEGFLLNKFRGDVRLLDPAPADLRKATGVPVVGVLPWLDHALPAEEGPTEAVDSFRAVDGPLVAIVCGPYASNLDEFVALQQVARVHFVGGAAASPGKAALDGAALIVLPGSKHVGADLAWLRERRLDIEIKAAAGTGVPVLGICGGLQMLGEAIEDPAGVESAATGLGLLPIGTTYRATKRTERTAVSFGRLDGPWRWLSERQVSGYEIRHGVTEAGGATDAVLPDGLGYRRENVLGVYLHGILEDADVVEALTGRRPQPIASAFDQLADAVDSHLDRRWLEDRVRRR